MEIIIHDSYKIREIQDEFSKHFPYLKLEFFEFAPGIRKAFSKNNLITDTEKRLADTRHLHLSGTISINGHQKTGTLKKHLADNFGLYAGIFRKSGNTWVQLTDEEEDRHTLSEQNKKGMQAEEAITTQAAVDFEQYYAQM